LSISFLKKYSIINNQYNIQVWEHALLQNRNHYVHGLPAWEEDATDILQSLRNH
jgi:hypothetical protein